MGKEVGYVNLILGRGWNKGKGNKARCSVCKKEFFRSKSSIKSENVFCSIKCKGKGMSMGLCKPMRLGTGCKTSLKYFKRKFYKYRIFDELHKLELSNYSVWDLVKRLKNSECVYCGNKENLGLDRINNNLGHTISNTVVSCELCNMTRGKRFTVKEMKMIGKVIQKIKRIRGDEVGN